MKFIVLSFTISDLNVPIYYFNFTILVHRCIFSVIVQWSVKHVTDDGTIGVVAQCIFALHLYNM